MVKRTLLWTAALFLFCTAPAASPLQAQGRLGVGVVFGEPTGIAWRYTIDGEHAADGAIGLTPYDRFRIHGDYLWRSYPFEDDHLALHYGAGVAIGVRETDVQRDGRSYLVADNEFGFGIRAVAGLTYLIPRSPVDLFLEVAPVIVLAPAAGVGFDAGFGVRVYP